MSRYVRLTAAVGAMIFALAPSPGISFTIFEFPNLADGHIHQEITLEALESYTLMYNGREIGQFSEAALHEIIDGNRDADLFLVNDKAVHFDSEMLAEGLAFIESTRDDLLKILGGANPYEEAESARYRLGTLLHTLQDFYAHSNWVDNGNSSRLNFYDIPDSVRTRFTIGDSLGLTPVCEENTRPIQGAPLSTGYHPDLPTDPAVAAVKCLHGSVFDILCIGGGLNKDRKCRGHRHMLAKHLAREESAFFVSALLAELRDGEAITGACALIGIKRGQCPDIYYAEEIAIDDAMSYTYDFIDARGDRVRGQSEAPVRVRFTEMSLDLRSTPVTLSGNFLRTIGPDTYFGAWEDPATTYRAELSQSDDELMGASGGPGDTWTWRLKIDEDGQSISGTATNIIDVPNATGGRNRDSYSTSVTFRLATSP